MDPPPKKKISGGWLIIDQKKTMFQKWKKTGQFWPFFGKLCKLHSVLKREFDKKFLKKCRLAQWTFTKFWVYLLLKFGGKKIVRFLSKSSKFTSSEVRTSPNSLSRFKSTSMNFLENSPFCWEEHRNSCFVHPFTPFLCTERLPCFSFFWNFFNILSKRKTCKFK